MSDFVETSAPETETAIQQALSQLGLTRDQVKIEVLEEPQRRLLGLGGKPARVRVTALPGAKRTVAAPPTPIADPDSFTPDPELAEQLRQVAPTRFPIPARPATVSLPPPPARARESFHEDGDDDHDHESAPVDDVEHNREAEIGVQILSEVVRLMGFEATVTARPADTDGREARHWLLDVRGQDLDLLIGNHGETLGSLQTLTRLMVSQHINRRANVVIDIAGYKARREDMLRRLARRMAAQAIERGRTVTLEPMPPHERRIIHLALRNDPNVKTESLGEGDRRKVTIIPKKGAGR